MNRSLCLFGDGRVRDFFVSKTHQITFFFHQAITLEGLTHVLLKYDSKLFKENTFLIKSFLSKSFWIILEQYRA